MRSRSPWGILALLFVVVPLAEIYVLVQVGQVVGAGWTIMLLIADSILGAFLIRHEGRRAWDALRQALTRNQMPARELADGTLILVGGTLLLTPGFLTDVLGLFCVLPFTRPLVRHLLTGYIGRRFVTVAAHPGGRGRSGSGTDGVVEGEVVD